MYLVIQKGYAIFGQGSTPNQAVEDMKQWIDQDADQQTWGAYDFAVTYENASVGEFVLVEATDELLQQYQ